MGVTDTDEQLIDVHAHFLTDAYIIAARAAGHVHPDGMAGWPNWSAEEHLRLMDRWGVATAVLSISSPGTHFGDDASARRLTREVNEAGAAISRANPGRFGHFASLPLPDVPGALDELGYALDELDSDGITIETNSAGVYLGNDRYEPLYRELDGRAVLVRPTSPPCAEAIALAGPADAGVHFQTTRAVSDLVFTGTLVRFPESSGSSSTVGAHYRFSPIEWSFSVLFSRRR